MPDRLGGDSIPMGKRKFKTESKRLLDLMINSIYTHKEIFLRELISNASDAIDKLYYESMSKNITGLAREDFAIRITADKDARTLTISDNGIGMTEQDLDQNLGVIAKSGSLDFKENVEDEDIDIIGQFGVGFYSAFMVADKVTVISKAYGEEQAHSWESDGADGYTIEEAEKESHGTDIILHMKESTAEEDYDIFLREYKIRALVKKYSDYIRYPIKMMVDVPAPVEPDESADSEEAKSEPKAPKMIKEDQTLNTMVPLWKRQKSELTDEDYNSFYKGKFYDPEDPARVIHTSVEGVSSFTALMFIPKKAPFNYYTRDFQKGLQLYSSGVLIMDRCEELVPDYFSFVRGLVDSQDLSLNISREMLQHDRQLKNIAKNITRKIRNELADFLKNDREGYEAFYENFGPQLKFGMYQDFGLHKGDLEDLVMYYSSSEKKMVTLAEYVERMPEDQTHIYYAAGDSIEHIDRMPRTEALKEKGTEILYVTDDIDEFVFQTIGSYKEKTFLSVKQDDPAAEQDEAAKEALEKKEEEYKDLLAAIKASLGDKVSEVKLTDRLAEHPVCLTTKGGLSLEMERVLNAAPAGEAIKAERVLEINADHEILDVLKAAQAEDKEKMDTYAQLLYDQALLIEGMPIDDPVRFSTEVCKLMK